MRIWKVNPKKICRRHLLGEHVECHMFAGAIKKNKNITGHIKKGQIEIHNLKARHEELAKELKARGYNHKSQLPSFKANKAGKINIKANYKELARRCKDCRKLIKTKSKHLNM
jgi:predicted RNase H-like nuclease (RuvC/YqgF family)